MRQNTADTRGAQVRWRAVLRGAAVLAVLLGTPVFAQAEAVIRPPERAVVPAATPPRAPATSDAVAPAAVVSATGAIEVAGPAQDAPRDTSIPYDIRPPARRGQIPRTRWQHMQGNAVWTRAALSALKTHGKPLVDMVPRDIAQWCPAYATNTDRQRRAFWVGYMSTLAKYESTYKPWAVGGGGRWYGLLQILPATARGYECAAGTGEALKSGAANLSCGVRIMTHTVKRDGVIHGRDSRWRGVSADWGPMRSPSKRRDMAAWLKRQTYCQSVNTLRPRARP